MRRSVSFLTPRLALHEQLGSGHAAVTVSDHASGDLRYFPLILLFCWIPNVAFAWGQKGHEIVARIAASELTPHASRQIADLLGSTDVESRMARVASWADDIRRARPETGAWHYVDIELGTDGYSPRTDCPNGQCVVEQIKKDLRIFADSRSAAAARAEALLFLIHFLGDIHQPLHDIDNHDRGANQLLIRYAAHRFSMHSLWDEEMVEQLGAEDASIARQFERDVSVGEKKAIMAGTPEQWANEGYRIAKRDVYGKFDGEQGHIIEISNEYLARERPVIQTQLTRAGLRLAWLLNSAFP